VIHIKETEIIPFLKTAQTGYTKMISEGDLEMEVELAEKVEEALTQAMDIIYDYQSMADEHKRMVEKYETEAPVIKRGVGQRHSTSVCNVCDGRYRHDTKQGGYR
jgi:hypothetical protein